MKTPTISVLVVVGADRARSVLLLKSLAEQTILDEMEIILVDIAPADAPELIPPPGLMPRVLRHPGSFDWGAARAAAVHAATTPLVAFLEDHTVPDRNWALEVRKAFDRSGKDVNSLCYSFTNGSPDTYFYRSVFMVEYGALAHPLPEGEPPSTTANNIAYRREMLLSLGDRLGDLLEMDFFLQRFLGEGFKAVSAPRAVVAHQTNTGLRDLVVGHFKYAQLFANRRVRHEGWSIPKRILGVISVPFLVPILRLIRLFAAIRGRSLTRDAVLGLPVILLLYISCSLGEAVGLLLGGEVSAKQVIWLELEAPRKLR